MIDEPVAVGVHALEGELTVPYGACGLVLFVHGSGGSRKSSRNRSLAHSLQQRKVGTLLFDLLTSAEGALREKIFDIALLMGRTVEAIDWVRGRRNLREVPLGLFGAGTGATAALCASVERPHDVAAVVSRSGRPDLAGAALDRVSAPTLLIVGEADTAVWELNLAAYRRMRCEKLLHVVPRATHLFEEAGALEAVAAAAGDWFARHLGARASPPG